MKHTGKYITLVFIVVLTGFLLNSCAPPTTQKPIGKLTKEEIITRYFKDRNIDNIEGIWVREDSTFEIAIIKNTVLLNWGVLSLNKFPGYDYIGIVTDTNNSDWEIGETKLLIKKTSNKNTYSISYFDDRAKVTKSEKKTDMIMMGDYVAKIKENNYLFIKQYPQPEATCRIGFQVGTNLALNVVSPYARNAGFQPGDKIKAIDGDQVLNSEDIVPKINRKRAGDHVKILVERNKQKIEIESICKDGRAKLQQEIDILMARAQHNWDKCISASYLSELEWGASSWYSGVRLDCSEEKRIEEELMPDLNSAEVIYEHRRRIIAEAVYSQEDLESIRSDVLRVISQLEADRFTTFANELRKQWEAAITLQSSSSTHIEIPDATKLITSKYDDLLNCVVVVRNSSSMGTGFLITADGYIITNNHVVDRDKTVSIKLRNGKTIFGDVLSTDSERDLALIKVDGSNYPWLTLGKLTDSHVGDDVIAVGTPQGLEWSVSKGIVSAIRRSEDSAYIQTDTAINPGNSGGPLISLKNGNVIGVNTFGFRKDIAEGLNFAVSAEEIIKAFPQIQK